MSFFFLLSLNIFAITLKTFLQSVVNFQGIKNSEIYLFSMLYFKTLDTSTQYLLKIYKEQFGQFLLVCAKSLQSYLIFCSLIDCSPPGSSVHRILLARILEWVVITTWEAPQNQRGPHRNPCHPASHSAHSVWYVH